MLVPALKALVASARSAVEAAWDDVLQLTREVAGDLSPSERWAAGGVVILLAIALFVRWRKRVAAEARIAAAIRALYPPPKHPPPRPDTMTFRLDRRKHPETRSSPLAPDSVEQSEARISESEPIPAVAGSELSTELLRRLEWKRFELIVQRYFDASGSRAECTWVGADGGVDIHLYRSDDPQPYGYVQCQACGARAVNVEPVAGLCQSIATAQVEGVFVTSGSFTPGAQVFAQIKGVTLIDGDAFVARFNALAPAKRSEILEEVTAGDYLTPTCRRCDVKLELDGEQGAVSWRCPRAPRCAYTVPAGPGLR